MSQPKHLLKDVSFNPEDFKDKDYNPHIAFTLPSQNGAASKKNKAFLFKSDEEPTIEIIKELEQVQLKLSMEEFLSKFFGLWEGDAQVLTKIMGLETEAEYKLTQEEGKENPDPWDMNYWKDEIEYTENKASRVQMLKSLQDNKELQVKELLEVFNIRKSFEEGYFKDKDNIENILKSTKEEIPSEVIKTDEEINSDVSGKEQGLAPSNINKNDKEITVDSEILKSQEFKDLLKSEIQKATEEKDAQIESLLKAENARLEKGFVKLVKGFEFIEDEVQVELVKFFMKDMDSAEFVTGILKSASEAVATAKAEAVEAKESFGVVKSVDASVELNNDVKKAEDDLASFAEMIKSQGI